MSVRPQGWMLSHCSHFVVSMLVYYTFMDVDYQRVRWFMAGAILLHGKERWPMDRDANRAFALVVDKLTEKGNAFAKRFATFPGIMGKHCPDFDEMLSYALSGSLVCYLSPEYRQFLLNLSANPRNIEHLFEGATDKDRAEVAEVVEAFWNRANGLDEPEAILYQLRNALYESKKKKEQENSAPNADDDKEFARLVRLTLDSLGVPDKELAARFGTSIPTITRWKKGTTQPHPYMRPSIFEALMKVVEDYKAQADLRKRELDAGVQSVDR